jgi:PadR family transcriptional regulator PadR
MLETYDEPFDGRNRRYYKITDQGKALWESAVQEWHTYKQRVETLLMTGGTACEQD